MERTADHGREEIDFDQLYEDIAITCFQYFGFKTLDEVDAMTIREYVLLCEATQRREKAKIRDIMTLAWQTFRATGKKKVGQYLKPIYPTFEKFYSENNEDTLAKADSLKERYRQLQERLK